MGRVDGWMLLGPLSCGVSPWPHQSGQTRRGPDSVTGAGWSVRQGAPVGIYSPAVLTTTASGHRIISTREHSRLLLRYFSLLTSYYFTDISRPVRWLRVRNEYRVVSGRDTDRKFLISLKHLLLRQRRHLRHKAASRSRFSLKEYVGFFFFFKYAHWLSCRELDIVRWL